jgi:NitT/TauT family transport system substrate-binding protein
MRLAPVAALSGIVLLAAACGSGGQSSQASGSSSGPTTVQVMMYAGLLYRAPIVIASEQGFFKSHGITAKFVDQPVTGLTTAQALTATKSDVGVTSVSSVAQGQQAGIDDVYFCGLQTVQAAQFLALPNSNLPSTSDGASLSDVFHALAGKKIGVQTPIGSPYELQTASVFEAGGATGATFITTGTTASVTLAALQNKSVAVVQSVPPITSELLAMHAVKLVTALEVDDPAWKSFYGTGLMASKTWVADNPKVADGFCSAVQEGIRFMTNSANANVVEKALSQDLGITHQIAAAVVANDLGSFKNSQPISVGNMDSTLNAYVKLGILKSEPKITYDDVVAQPGR